MKRVKYTKITVWVENLDLSQKDHDVWQLGRQQYAFIYLFIFWYTFSHSYKSEFDFSLSSLGYAARTQILVKPNLDIDISM